MRGSRAWKEFKAKIRNEAVDGTLCHVMCDRRRQRKHSSRGGEGQGESRTDARTRCFKNWKRRAAAWLCIHLDGHR